MFDSETLSMTSGVGATLGGCQVFREWFLPGGSRVSYHTIPLPGTPPCLTMVGRNSEIRTRGTISSLTLFLLGVLVAATQE